MVDFKSQDLESRLLHVYYAWSTGGPCQHPMMRDTSSPESLLYKLQLVGYPSPVASKESGDPVPGFLSTFLPAAQTEIVSASLTR